MEQPHSRLRNGWPDASEPLIAEPAFINLQQQSAPTAVPLATRFNLLQLGSNIYG